MHGFVVIEGLIGVGKTSLCRILESEWNARLVLEPWDDNPFLAQFYADPERFAFPTQMFYLATRYAQQLAITQTDLFRGPVVSDYLWAKDRLFAEQTLGDDELALYERFVDLLVDRIPAPDFVVFLDSPTEVVMERIGRRGIHAEKAIEASYLDALRDRYYRLWDDYTEAPVYVVDTSRINYVDRQTDRDRILAMLGGWMNGEPIANAPEPYRKAEPQQVQLFG